MTAGVPNFTELSEARISVLRPLQVDDYGVIVIPTSGDMVSIMIGRGEFPIFSEYLRAYLTKFQRSRSHCTLLQNRWQKRQA